MGQIRLILGKLQPFSRKNVILSGRFSKKRDRKDGSKFNDFQNKCDFNDFGQKSFTTFHLFVLHFNAAIPKIITTISWWL